MHTLTDGNAFFVTRAKSNMRFRRITSSPVVHGIGIKSDQVIMLTGINSCAEYPDRLRRIHYFDPDDHRHLYFLTNNFSYPATTIAALYKCRWRVELFFKWIKQHLRIKAFYGLSENAVKSQIWIAITVYVLLAIIKKKMGLEMTLHTILQVASVSLFEKLPLNEAFSEKSVTEM
jgi:IS4 transposase